MKQAGTAFCRKGGMLAVSATRVDARPHARSRTTNLDDEADRAVTQCRRIAGLTALQQDYLDRVRLERWEDSVTQDCSCRKSTIRFSAQ